MDIAKLLNMRVSSKHEATERDDHFHFRLDVRQTPYDSESYVMSLMSIIGDEDVDDLLIDDEMVSRDELQDLANLFSAVVAEIDSPDQG